MDRIQPDDSDESEAESEENQDEYDELIEDHRRGTYLEEDTQERDDVQDFENLLKASQRGLYPGCKSSNTLLSFVIKILHVKVESGCSNKSFDKVLQIFKDFLPEGHVVPESVYEAKKLLQCEEPRYKVNDGKRKKIPHKVLRYFPLTPWLRRLYMSRKTATEMRWHSEKRVDDGIARHPADSVEWKEFDKKYPKFSQETRNVRLGLATDGFNPFGNMSTSYSMWPVILMPYNLPPWMCMKEPFLMMSLLILGPNSPGNDIDVYLRPMVDELKELWHHGVSTYDASTKQTFQMHAAMMWTINDFPAFGNLSGWSTKGYNACPS
ncbi:hypothetical protein AAC387_Pa06g1755 [Persea americana]